jgi:hypothetical protein
MTRALAISIFLILLIAALSLSERQHRPQSSLPLIESAMPVIAPARSVPCNIPPPAPRPVVQT